MKNFLQTFRGPFLKYLKFRVNNKNHFKQIPIIDKMIHKISPSKGDYEELLNHPEFRPYLRDLFAQKILYQGLMQSGTSPNNKITYLRHILVFERVFRLGVFESIM
jgi:hypothetical protein